MKKKMIIAAMSSCLVFSSVVFNACKKEKQSGPESQLLGLWKVNYTGFDQNKNGQLEETEKAMIPDTSRFNFQFTAGGNGETTMTPSLSTGVTTITPFTWDVNEAGTSLTIYSNRTTMVVTLITLNNHVLNGSYLSGTDRIWIYATK